MTKHVFPATCYLQLATPSLQNTSSPLSIAVRDVDRYCSNKERHGSSYMQRSETKMVDWWLEKTANPTRLS
jgi:hypothetical protein